MLSIVILVGLVGYQALGQGAQADQIKRRARELNNQNNVRQGVAPPTQAPVKPVTVPAAPAARATVPTLTQPQAIARLQADIAAIKPGSAVTAAQMQQLIKDVAVSVRGINKPTLQAVTKFVNGLTAALADKTLGTAEQARLAQDIDAVVNSAGMGATQFDALIADVQAILQVGDVKRASAIGVANDLKAVGQEVRRTAH